MRILYAVYGLENKSTEVTKIVADKLKNGNPMEVTNITFEGDPAPNFIKHLFVVYFCGKEVKTLRAIEGSSIKFINDTINLDEKGAEKKIKYLENEQKIGDIFKGEWELTFTKDGATSSERVIIDDRGIYYANGVATFILKAIVINDSGNKVKFDKVSFDGIIHSTEEISFYNPVQAMGNNNLGYRLVYKKRE